MKNYIPVGHRILIKEDSIDFKEKINSSESFDEITTESGFKLALPKETSEKLKKDQMIEESAIFEGTVVSMGKKAYYGVHDGEAWVKPGDKVLYIRYAGNRIPKQEKQENQYRLIDDSEVLAIIEEK